MGLMRRPYLLIASVERMFSIVLDVKVEICVLAEFMLSEQLLYVVYEGDEYLSGWIFWVM